MDEVLGLLSTFWHIVGRRRWIALFVAWGICVAGWLGVASLPDQYEAKAQIYVDTQTLLGPLLQGIAVQEDINQQVSVIKRTLFTRPNLEKVMRDNDLDLQVENSAQLEALLERIENSAAIKTSGRNLFTLSYVDQDPVLARDITKTFLDIFISTNVGQNRTGMETARSFIENQIVKYEKQLDAAEKRLAEFKTRNADMLTGGEFFSRYEAAQSEFREVERDLQDGKVNVAQLKQRIENTPRFLQVEERQNDTGGGSNAPTEAELAKQRVDEAANQLEELLAIYTENHPDVQRQKALVAKSRKRLEEENAKLEAERASGKKPRMVTSEIPNKVYEELQLRLLDAEQSVNGLQSKFDRLSSEYAVLQEQRKTAPQVEAELKGLDRDYNVIKGQYETLLERREAASISAAREASTDAVQFRIVDPPQVPAVPVGPKRLIFSAAILIVGLGGGFALPVLLALVSGCFYSRRQLEDAFDLPVLGTVGYVTGSLNSAGKLMNNLLSFGMLTLLIVLFGAVVYFAPEPSMMNRGIGVITEIAEQYNIPYYIDRIVEVLDR